MAALGGGDDVFAMAAADTLWLSRSSYPWLAKDLRSKNPKVRMRALIVLGRKKYIGKEEVPLLLKLLKDKDFKVRGNAIWAIGEIKPGTGDPAGALVGLFGAGNWGRLRKRKKLHAKDWLTATILKTPKLCDTRTNGCFPSGRLFAKVCRKIISFCKDFCDRLREAL